MTDNRFKEGYLDLRMNNCIEEFRKKYDNEYNCIKEIDSFIYKVQDSLSLKGGIQSNVFIMAALLQLQKMYNSSILLFERGLNESANALIRIILELSFKIIEVIRNEDFVEDLILFDDYESLKMLTEIEQHELYDMVSKEEIEKDIEIINNRIDNRKKTKIKTSDLAQKNGLYKEYVLYRLQCDYVHQSAGIIGKNVKRTKDGVLFLDGDLQLQDFKKSIGWLISITTISIGFILKEYLQNMELIKEYKKIMKRFEMCFKDLL